MNFEDYVQTEFQKGEKKFTKLETKIDIMDDKLDAIRIAMEVERQLKDGKTKRIGMIYGGIMSVIVGVIMHLLQGVL